MSKHMYQIKAMLDHSMSSGFWMDGEEIPYDDLIKYLDRLKQERERWKAAVEEMIEQIDTAKACYELSEEEQVALPAEKEALNALLDKMEEADEL